MKYVLLIILFNSATSFAQEIEGENSNQGESVIVVNTVMPEFPGGPAVMAKFIQKTSSILKYYWKIKFKERYGCPVILKKMVRFQK